jgi:putative FmdB family regulatory protein
MPIYEYECPECSRRFEKRQSFHDEPKADCPECQAAARRVFHPAPIIFKGSGFYVTDHRDASSSSASGSGSGSGSDSSSSKSSDSKPSSSGSGSSEASKTTA